MDTKKHPTHATTLSEIPFTKTLSFRFFGLSMLFVVLIALNLGTSYWNTEQQKIDTLIVNVAGQQAALSQRMTKESLIFVRYRNSDSSGSEGTEFARLSSITPEQVTQTAAVFDGTLQELTTGDRAKSRNIEGEIDTIRRQWLPFRARMAAVVGDVAAEDDVETIIALDEKLRTAIEGLVVKTTAGAQARVQRSLWIQAGFLAASIPLLFMILLVVRRSILQPLSASVAHASVVGDGDLTAKLDDSIENRQDELGLLARALNRMTYNLRDTVSGALVASNDVCDAANHIVTASAEQGTGLTDTAEGIEAISGEMENVLKTAGKISDELAGLLRVADTVSAQIGEQGLDDKSLAAELGVWPIADVVRLVSGTADAAKRISTKSQQAVDVSEQMYALITELANISSDFAGVAQEINQTSGNMAELSTKLGQQMSRFHIGGNAPRSAEERPVKQDIDDQSEEVAAAA